MTEKTAAAMRESFARNGLYRESSSLHKGLQLERFHLDGKPLDGRRSRTENIGGVETLVIYSFRNGLIHSDGDSPAVEYPTHWEYWKDGLIERVVDGERDTEEQWRDGVPVRIERNLSCRRK